VTWVLLYTPTLVHQPVSKTIPIVKSLPAPNPNYSITATRYRCWPHMRSLPPCSQQCRENWSVLVTYYVAKFVYGCAKSVL